MSAQGAGQAGREQVLKGLAECKSIGLGLMHLTWRPDPVEFETAYEIIKASIDMNAPSKTFLNGGEFYGEDHINLKLISGFFQKYPSYREKTIISIKGAIDENLSPTTDYDSVVASIDNVAKYIDVIDIYEPARIDKSVVNETIKALDDSISNGKIKSFGLSEVSASTIKEVCAKSQYGGPVAVELEVNLMSREVLSNGIIEYLKQVGNIHLIAYSPLSRGLLTGAISKKEDIPEGDFRHHLDRFSEENLSKNNTLVEEVNALAKDLGITPAQLSLSWVVKVGEIHGVKTIAIPSCSSIPRVEENFKQYELSDNDYHKLTKIVESKQVHGLRYNEHSEAVLYV